MELLSPAAATTTTIGRTKSAILHFKAEVQASTLYPTVNLLPNSSKKKNGCRIISSCNSCVHSSFSSSISSKTTRIRAITPAIATSSDYLLSSSATGQQHWMVIMDKPPLGLLSKPEIIDYFVKTLAKVLGSEKEAQKCIYDVSWQTHFGFCCDIDEEISRELEGISGVLCVRPDHIDSVIKDYSFPNLQLGHLSNSIGGSFQLFPKGKSKYWLVRMEKPAVEVVTKAQMVDYYAQILTKVLGNEKDAQMCIYHISWQNDFGFCCELDEECAKELAGVPGVLSVQIDGNFESENKDYRADKSQKTTDLADSDTSQTVNLKTKRLFITGLSFYTSEKTLRAAFEGFGELVDVKIIMDKISKRSKGYAFIEYTTEEAAGAALKEMNGKIINGWMIVVDVAKKNPPRYSRGGLRPTGF